MKLTLCKLIIRISFLRKRRCVATDIQSPITNSSAVQPSEPCLCPHTSTQQAMNSVWSPPTPQKEILFSWLLQTITEVNGPGKKISQKQLGGKALPRTESQCLIIEFPSWKCLSAWIHCCYQALRAACFLSTRPIYALQPSFITVFSLSLSLYQFI